MPELQQASGEVGVPSPVGPAPEKSQKSFVDQITNNFNPSKFDKGTLVVVVLAGIVVLEFLVAWFMTINKQSAIRTQDEKISQANQQINSPTMDPVVKQYKTIEKGLASYKSLNPESTDLAKMFSELEKTILENTRISSITYSSEGSQIQISGEARSYIDVAKLVTSFKKSKILTGVDLSSTSSAENIKQYVIKTKYVNSAKADDQSKDVPNQSTN